MNEAPLRSNLIAARDLLSQSQDPDLRLFDCRFSLVDPGQGPRALS